MQSNESPKIMSKIFGKGTLLLVLGFIIGIIYTVSIVHISLTYSTTSYSPEVRLQSNFTCNFDYYESLLKEMNKDRYAVLRVVDFIKLYRNNSLPLNKVIIILRHDVDFSPHVAYKMYELELKYGIRSTYYIRTRGPYNILEKRFTNWLKEISKAGFEVGLHYETLYYTDYDFNEAERLFEIDLTLLRKIIPVYTVCSHGNAPKQKYINYEIFVRDPSLYSKLKVEGEAYLTVFKILRELKSSGNIKTYIYLSDTYRKDVDWIGFLQNATRGSVIYLLIHPDNWQT